MTERENLISLLRRTGYEYMPIDFSMTPGAAEKLKGYRKETAYTSDAASAAEAALRFLTDDAA